MVNYKIIAGVIMGGCELHNMCSQELSRLKSDVGNLYDLDRETTKAMNQLMQDVTEIKTNHKNMKEDIKQFQIDMKEVKTDMSEVKKDMSDVKNEMRLISQKLEVKNESKWQPKDKAIVVVAALALIGTVFSTIFTYLK